MLPLKTPASSSILREEIWEEPTSCYLGDCDLTCHMLPHKARLSFLFGFCIPLTHIWPKSSYEFCVHFLPSSLVKDPKDLSPLGPHLWYLHQPKRTMTYLEQTGRFPQDPHNFLFHLTLEPLIFPSLHQCLQGKIAAECSPTWTDGELSFIAHFRIRLLSREISSDYLSLKVFSRNN